MTMTIGRKECHVTSSRGNPKKIWMDSMKDDLGYIGVGLWWKRPCIMRENNTQKR